MNSEWFYFLALVAWLGAFFATELNEMGWEILLLSLMVSMFVLYGLRRLEERKPWAQN